MNILNFFHNSIKAFTETDEKLISVSSVLDNPKANIKPAGRVSEPEYVNNVKTIKLPGDYSKPDVVLEIIPEIRKLVRSNEDMGSVYNDLIQLTNTGHNIKFDSSVKSTDIDKMKKHLKRRSKNWGSGVHGINGLVNKWIGQIWVSGALSTEWIPAKDLTGVENVALVNPENIRFKYNSTTTRYEAYQLIKHKIVTTNYGDNSIKLNPETYFYAGILNDTDSPYGIPPFLTAVESITDQKLMKNNIKHILKQVGLLGYLEVKVDKPDMEPAESMPAYKARLEQFLTDTKKAVEQGFMRGVVVGYQDDHEFNFHSTTKNINGVSELFNLNEVQIANGLKTSPSFIGQKSGGTETNMGIVFTKMLSQLKSIQEIVATNLAKGYLLELRLAGFDINYIKVEFKTSTITDDLKLWQAKEIKQRTLKELIIDGIIDQDQYADEMGYDKAYKPGPLVPYDQQIGKAKDPEAKQKREQGKDKSDRTSRDKKKDQPRRKDQDSKPR